MMRHDSGICKTESPTSCFLIWKTHLQRNPDKMYFSETDTGNYVMTSIYSNHVASAVSRNDGLECTCLSKLNGGKGAVSIVSRVKSCIAGLPSRTDTDKEFESVIFLRHIGHRSKDLCSAIVNGFKRSVDFDMPIGISKAPDSKHYWSGLISTSHTNGCQNNSKESIEGSVHKQEVAVSVSPEVDLPVNGCRNNSASDSSTHKESIEGSAHKQEVSVSVLPEVDLPVRSTPDSTQSASTSIPNPRSCSYLELFKAKRKIEESMKKYCSARQHIPHAQRIDGEDGTYVHPLGIAPRKNRLANVDNYPGNGNTSRCQLQQEERGLSKDLTGGGVPSCSESPIGSPQREHIKRNRKQPFPEPELHRRYESSPQRKRRTSSKMEESLPSFIRHLNRVNNSDNETGSNYSGKGNRNVISKVQLKNGSKRKHIHVSPTRFYPDPELTRIYGGIKHTSLNLHKTPRNKDTQNSFCTEPNDTSGERKLRECHENEPTIQSYISDRNGTKRCTLESILNNHGLKMGGETLSVKRQVFRCAINGRHGMLEPMSPVVEPETQIPKDTSPSETSASCDLIGINSVKGILKSPGEKSLDSEPSQADNSYPENVAARRVRFEEMDFPDDIYETLECYQLRERYDGTNIGQSNARPLKQNRASQSRDIETGHFLRSSGFKITSPSHFGNVATIERNLSVIQHFQDVGDYDKLYPGNCKATRWHDICNEMPENRTGGSGNFGGIACRVKCHITDNFGSGQTVPDGARDAISNVSNDESDGRASGDGYTTHAHGSVNRMNSEHQSDRAYEDGIPRSHYSRLLSEGPNSQAPELHEEDGSARMSREARGTSAETNRRHQKAIERLEQALRHGIMHASSENMSKEYQDRTVSRDRKSLNTDEGHVDLIDLKALDERVSGPRRRDVPLPPCARYRNTYDYASNNNNSVWNHPK